MVRLAHMVEGRLNAGAPLLKGRHATGRDLAGDPGLQGLAQQAKVMAVELRRVGPGQRLGMDGLDQRQAVVFIERRLLQRLQALPQALTDAGVGLPLALQGAGERFFGHRAPA